MRIGGIAAAAALGLVASTAPALAHVGAGPTAGFTAGLAHPLTGLDHLLAMIAVGIWASQMAGRAVWALPAGFLGSMALGGTAGLAGLSLPGVELGIALSVLLLGVAIWATLTPALAWAVAAVVVAGFLHGHAHGGEVPPGGSELLYSAGFILMTAVLHGIGVAGGALLANLSRLPVRLGGAAVAVVGAAFLIGI